MDNITLHKRLSALGITIPEGTLRRWVHEGILPRPGSLHKGKGGGAGRFSDWPEETVERAAVVYSLRHSDTRWAKPTAQAIIETKKVVDEFYTIIRESDETSDVNLPDRLFSLLTWVETSDGKRGMMYASYDLHPLVVIWIAILEKIRNNKLLSEHYKATFRWTRRSVKTESGEVFRLVYKGVTLATSDRDSFGFTFDRAAEQRPKKRTFNVSSNWNFVSIDVNKQIITITDPETRGITIIDLKSSDYELFNLKNAVLPLKAKKK
jgi:hypothetical protein